MLWIQNSLAFLLTCFWGFLELQASSDQKIWQGVGGRWPFGRRHKKFPLFALEGPPSGVWVSPYLKGSIFTMAQSPLTGRGKEALGGGKGRRYCRKEDCPLPSYWPKVHFIASQIIPRSPGFTIAHLAPPLPPEKHRALPWLQSRED